MFKINFRLTITRFNVVLESSPRKYDNILSFITNSSSSVINLRHINTVITWPDAAYCTYLGRRESDWRHRWRFTSQSASHWNLQRHTWTTSLLGTDTSLRYLTAYIISHARDSPSFMVVLKNGRAWTLETNTNWSCIYQFSAAFITV